MDQTFRLNLFIFSSISLRVPVSWMDCGGKVLLPELLWNLDPPALTNLRSLFVHSYARSCHNSTKQPPTKQATMAIVKSIAVAFLAVQAASAANLRAQHRQLSFVEIAGYEPNSQVTDHVSFICSIATKVEVNISIRIRRMICQELIRQACAPCAYFSQTSNCIGIALDPSIEPVQLQLLSIHHSIQFI